MMAVKMDKPKAINEIRHGQIVLYHEIFRRSDFGISGFKLRGRSRFDDIQNSPIVYAKLTPVATPKRIVENPNGNEFELTNSPMSRIS